MSSRWAAVVLGSAMSVLVCQLGGLWWERKRRSADLLFSDLLLWGWIRRGAMERRLANATRLFPSTSTAEKAGDLKLDDPLALLRQLAADLEAADPYTHGHSRRVARYASLIARGMDLPPAEVAKIRLAAALHDIGKLHTPRGILDKPDRLTDDEFAVVKRHPGDGADMIQTVIDDPELVAIVRHHHERLDGKGYPSGLAADEIPLGARIIAVADTFDAITSTRSYRQPRPHKAALDIMQKEAGAQLDPNAVRAFRSAYFGRRWLWIPAAGVNAAGRLLAGAAAHVADTAVIAAGAAAIGATPLIVPPAPGTAQSPGATASLSRNTSSAAPIIGAGPGHNGAGISRVHHASTHHGQTRRIRPTSGTGHPRQAVPSVPLGVGSSGSTSASSGGSGSGGGSGTPSTGPGGSSPGRTVSAGPTTVTTGSHGSTVSTTVPGTTGTGASVKATSGTISASGTAAGTGAGVTIKTGLPTPSLPTPSLPKPLG
ncbi:MAG: HD-GYP domain-containing protein [Actinomycetota bacterium]|nr:HD-GYP domain-containing protein [Actinomycetota bacterium]